VGQRREREKGRVGRSSLQFASIETAMTTHNRLTYGDSRSPTPIPEHSINIMRNLKVKKKAKERRMTHTYPRKLEEQA
jgi:hypothetical protein